MALSADGTRLVTGSDDETARLWDVRSSHSLREFKGHTSTVTSVALSADGSRLVTGSIDSTARLWDVRSGQSLQEFKGNWATVISVALSADGSRLVTGSFDSTVRLWDARTGESLQEFKGHTDPVTSVALSVDGSRLVSQDDSGKRIVWNTATGEAVGGEAPAELVKNTNLSPDGKFQYIPTGNRVLRVPTTIDEDERLMRLWATRPDPDWHVEQRIKFEKENNAYAAALHRSFEQQARGVVAVDSNQFDKAYWHFVAAALLKPPVPKAVEIVKEKK